MKTKCDICGKAPIDLMFSQNRYWCFHCRKFYPFKLKAGQRSILIKGLKGEDSEKTV